MEGFYCIMRALFFIFAQKTFSLRRILIMAN
ncbi:ECF-type riboflavin transporter substrate-binding protein, partial [Vibrio sp. 10N.222.54.A1]